MALPRLAITAVIVDSIFTAIGLLFVVLRLSTRISVVKNISANDYLIVAAMLCSIAYFACVMLQIENGLGDVIPFENLPGFLRSIWATVLAYTTATSLVKLSITVQYIRVFRNSFTSKFLWVYLVVLVIISTWTLFSSIFTCRPVEAYWNVLQGPTGVCFNRDVLAYLNASFSIATDFALGILPFAALRNLHLPKRQKYALLGIFAVGFVACIMSIVRLVSLYEIATSDPAEQSINGVDIAIWSAIEVNTAISCACMPTLKPLVRKWFPRLLPTTNRSKTATSTYRRHTLDTQVRRGTRGMSMAENSHAIVIQQSIVMEHTPATNQDTLSRVGSENTLTGHHNETKIEATYGNEIV